MIVGLGDEGDPRPLEGLHRAGRGVEDVLLGLGVGTGAVRQRGLEVRHRQVRTAEELGHRRAEGRCRVRGQAVAEIGSRWEVHVAPEREGDGPAVAIPVRTETGVDRRGGGLVLCGVVRKHRRMPLAAAARDQQGDEERQHQQPGGPDPPDSPHPA